MCSTSFICLYCVSDMFFSLMPSRKLLLAGCGVLRPPSGLEWVIDERKFQVCVEEGRQVEEGSSLRLSQLAECMVSITFVEMT